MPDRKFFTRLSELNTQLQKATVSSDAKAFGALLHEDWFTVDADGGITEKNKEVEGLARSAVSVDYEISDLKVQNYGKNIAVVTGVTRTKGSFEKRDVSGKYRFLQVWADAGSVGVANSSEWLMLACINFTL